MAPAAAVAERVQRFGELVAALGATWPTAEQQAAPARVIVREPDPERKKIAVSDLLPMLKQALEDDRKARDQVLALVGEVTGLPEKAKLLAELHDLEAYERRWKEKKGKVTPEAFAKDKIGKGRNTHYRRLKRLEEVRLLLSAIDETK